MRFSQLRLVGFKSFVEATALPIEPGLTGVVGPNGCGKSNLLEALRWVMGASSAKALRGEGMDDVIFAGSSARPARSHAEVTLTLESEGDAPPPFHAAPTLEVTRRIDRGEGSTYRVNGSEVRARDVQLLFADASTGANSPALVRQGQISELIAAAPRNRRRILEEAAGVSGLHGRRHEAEIKVRAAEANLERLADLDRELETSLARLRREARSASRYRKLGGEIRALRAAILHLVWREAREAERLSMATAKAASERHGQASQAAAQALASSLKAGEALAPLKEEQAVAAAVHQRLLIEQERRESALRQAEAEIARRRSELARWTADEDRESRDLAEAVISIDQLSANLSVLEAAALDAPEKSPMLNEALAAARIRRERADAELEAFTSALAASAAEGRAAREALNAAAAAQGRHQSAHRQILGELQALQNADTGALEAARSTQAMADAQLAAARAALEAAEGHRAEAASREADAASASRDAEAALNEARLEHRALSRAVASDDSSGAPTLINAVRAETGFELALAAALADDLEARLTPGNAAFWRDNPIFGDASPNTWPSGVEPLARKIEAPPRLGRRLSHVGLAAGPAEAERLQPGLPPGTCLVTRNGGLWRWDGYVRPPGAALAAAARLEHRSRLEALEARIAELEPVAGEARETHGAAREELRKREASVQLARQALPAAERSARETSGRVDVLVREDDRRLARLAAAEDALERLNAEGAALAQAVAEASARVPQPAVDDGSARLAKLRAEAAKMRDLEAGARLALEQHRREEAERTQRLDQAGRELAAWEGRRARAEARIVSLATDRDASEVALRAAAAAPAELAEAREAGMDALSTAEARRRRADDALSLADQARVEADRRARAAEAEVSQAREARAGAVARLEAASQRLAETAEALLRATGLAPDQAEAELAELAIAKPSDLKGAETHLGNLERDQAALGAVNLLAEEEATSVADRLAAMREERADLTGALERLRRAIGELNAEGRERLKAAFTVIDGHFRDLFTTLFEGGAAELRLIDSEDPLEAGPGNSRVSARQAHGCDEPDERGRAGADRRRPDLRRLPDEPGAGLRARRGRRPPGRRQCRALLQPAGRDEAALDHPFPHDYPQPADHVAHGPAIRGHHARARRLAACLR